MLILILIDVQYSQKADFSFEKGSYCQNHSSSSSLCLVKKIPPPPVNFLIPPPPHWGWGIYSPQSLPLFGKPWIRLRPKCSQTTIGRGGSNLNLDSCGLWELILDDP